MLFSVCIFNLFSVKGVGISMDKYYNIKDYFSSIIETWGSFMKEKKKAFIHFLRVMFSLQEDVATHDEIKTRLLDGGKITGTNMCVLICAMEIASVGLNTNSTAVIIGAMLISPLMGSILAMAYATTVYLRLCHCQWQDFNA